MILCFLLLQLCQDPEKGDIFVEGDVLILPTDDLVTFIFVGYLLSTKP